MRRIASLPALEARSPHITTDTQTRSRRNKALADRSQVPRLKHAIPPPERAPRNRRAHDPPAPDRPPAISAPPSTLRSIAQYFFAAPVSPRKENMADPAVPSPRDGNDSTPPTVPPPRAPRRS